MNAVLVQLITGEMLAVKRDDWIDRKICHSLSCRDFHFCPPGPTIPLQFSYHKRPDNAYIPGYWIEDKHVSNTTTEPLIAVETDKGDIVHVPIKWLMGGDPPWNAEWTVAYHVNGEAMSRRSSMDGREFLRSVRRTDVKEILG